MYIFKQPRIGGEVTLHTDHTFLWTDPQTVTGFWFALEDATLENGCMWAVPGGHRLPVRKRFRRASDDGGTEFEVFDPEPYPLDGEVPARGRARARSIVLHGALPHRSGPNRSDRSRHAYSLHAIDAHRVVSVGQLAAAFAVAAAAGVQMTRSTGTRSYAGRPRGGRQAYAPVFAVSPSAPPRWSTTAESCPAATSRTRRTGSRCAPSAGSWQPAR